MPPEPEQTTASIGPESHVTAAGEAPATRGVSGPPVSDASRACAHDNTEAWKHAARAVRRHRIAAATWKSWVFWLSAVATVVGTWMTANGHAEYGSLVISLATLLGGGNAVAQTRGGPFPAKPPKGK